MRDKAVICAVVFVVGLAIGYGVTLPSQNARTGQVYELIRLNRELSVELRESVVLSERIEASNRELRDAQQQAVALIAEAAVDLGRAASHADDIASLIIPVYDALGRIGEVVRVLGFGDYVFADAGAEK